MALRCGVACLAVCTARPAAAEYSLRHGYGINPALQSIVVVDGNKLLAHGAAGASTPVDTAARRLRGEGAHARGGRAGGQRLRLNFPNKREAARAKALGMPTAR